LRLQTIIKSGAVLSTVGVALLISFIVVLLVFPVIKECQNSNKKCEFSSTAPDPLEFVVKPIFLVTSLVVIAIGVSIIRFGTWYHHKKDIDI
jgi:predicted secreted protein